MLRTMLKISAASLAIAACGSLAHAEEKPADSSAASAQAAEEGIQTTAKDYWGSWGVDTEQMDKSVKPGDDFNQYVNGTWLKNFEIPADMARYGSFNLLHEKSEQRVRKIIEHLAASKPDSATPEGKVAAYYNAYMDVGAINAAGLSHIQPILNRIMALKSMEDVAAIFADPLMSSPVNGYVDVDSKQTDRYIFYFTQSGLGLPDRDYYLEDNERNQAIGEAYRKYMSFLLGKAGYEDPDSAAQSVYDFETEIAKRHWDRALGRNRNLTYNKVSRDELVKMAGDFPLMTVLEDMGIDDQEEFIVRQMAPTEEEIASEKLTEEQLAELKGGIPALFEQVNGTDINVLKAYLVTHLMSNFASTLPSDIDDASFAFYGKMLSGQEEQRPRWKRGVSAVEGALGEVVGKIYAERYFPPENKAAMDELVSNLRKAMAENLKDIDWMGDETKAQAQIKLDKFTPKIGYPDKFETYDDLDVSADNAFANSVAATKWSTEDQLSKLGQPVDKSEWFMLPETVNAYYSPNRNEIVFPAGILQPPFFNLSADPAVNYGAIGAVIGHEMGHGFDDQGSKSDGDGYLRNWWTDEDLANFQKLTSALVAQYDAMCPLDDGKTCVNGRLTLGENIGDLGGLSMAWRAYQLSLGGKEAPVIDGLTGAQRFFLGWAQVWRLKGRENYLRLQLKTDPHSPPRYRINGIVRNFDEWYKAFDVKPGDALYLPPEERIRIW